MKRRRRFCVDSLSLEGSRHRRWQISGTMATLKTESLFINATAPRRSQRPRMMVLRQSVSIDVCADIRAALPWVPRTLADGERESESECLTLNMSVAA